MPQTTLSDAERWDLGAIFPDPAASRAALRAIETVYPALEAARGRLGESAAILAETLDATAGAWRRLAAVRAYASLWSDEDTRDAERSALREEADLVATEIAARTAWIRPEILALAPERVETWLASEPRLGPHAFGLRDLLRRRAHVLGPSEERILSNASLLLGGPSQLFVTLNNAELPRPELTLACGERVVLTPVELQRLRSTRVREDRLRAYPLYFSAYAGLRETFGQNLFASIKAHLFQARARGYASCLEAALDADDVPASVYRNVISRVREALPILHRYCRLRARALGLDRLEYADLHGPLGAEAPRRYTTADAETEITAALAPLGRGYAEALERSLRGRWIDWHPAPGKRSGAYASGAAYDAHPYVLLNFTGDFDSVSTLAHELGHAIHSEFANRAQPFPTADYSIFVAEVASTLNEIFLYERMLERAADPGERIRLLANRLDTVRGTIFRQAMFAEFELAIHERAEAGEALTGRRLDAIYLDLVREWHGHDRQIVHVDEVYAVEWAAVPHFHYDFYVYQYATGMVAARALAEEIVRGSSDARERYLEFLSAGGSDYPLALLRRAGVDLERPEPYATAFAAVERDLDRLEALLDAR